MSEALTETTPAEPLPPTKRRRYSDEFKRDAVRLVVEEKYLFAAVGVCEQSLRTWHGKPAPKPEPVGEDAGIELKRVEMERAIRLQ